MVMLLHDNSLTVEESDAGGGGCHDDCTTGRPQMLISGQQAQGVPVDLVLCPADMVDVKGHAQEDVVTARHHYEVNVEHGPLNEDGRLNEDAQNTLPQRMRAEGLDAEGEGTEWDAGCVELILQLIKQPDVHNIDIGTAVEGGRDGFATDLSVHQMPLHHTEVLKGLRGAGAGTHNPDLVRG